MKTPRRLAFYPLLMMVVLSWIFAIPAPVRANEEKSWDGWKGKITLSLTETIGEPRSNEPVEVWVKLDEAADDGRDIRIIVGEGQEVPYQIAGRDENGSYILVFFANVPKFSSRQYFILFNNPQAQKPDYGQMYSSLDNQNKIWRTDGVFIRWAEKDGFNTLGYDTITTLKFDNNGDYNPTNDVDVLSDESWGGAMYYGYIGANISGDPKGFGSNQGQIVKIGPIFTELALGNARIRYYKHQKWVLANQYVDSMLIFNRSINYMKHGLGQEITIKDFGTGVFHEYPVGYSSNEVNPQYLAFRNPSQGIVFGAVAKNVNKWWISAKSSAAWDRYLYFDDSSNRPDAQIYWYSDTSNSYEGIEKFARQVNNPLRVEIITDTTPPEVTASPAGGLFNSATSVTLAASEPATIYYTTDGTEPTVASPRYQGTPIALAGSTTLKFMAVDPAGNRSPVYIEEYLIDPEPPVTEAAYQSPPGPAGWYNSEVQVILAAADNPGGSGIALTQYSLDGGATWLSYMEPFVITGEGIQTFLYRSADLAGNVEPAQRKTVRLDLTAPSTEAVVAGLRGNNGWYRGEVTVNLVPGDLLSGVAATVYSLDGLHWQEYTGPILISADGCYTLQYSSADLAGNREPVREISLTIDREGPRIQVFSPQAGQYFHSATLAVEFSAQDLLSGLAEVRGFLDNTPVEAGSLLELRNLVPGEHLFLVIAEDQAGNRAETGLALTVVASPDSLQALQEELFAQGLISNQGIYNSLTAKIRNTRAALTRGQKETAQNLLAAYLSEVKAQRGKHIREEGAALLEAEGNWVLDGLVG